MMRGMVIDTNNNQLLTLAQLHAFLNGTVAVAFSAAAFERIDAQTIAMSDNDAAQRLNGARAILFNTIFSRSIIAV